MEYITVACDESDDGIEIPCNADSSLPIARIADVYPNVVGLQYKVQNRNRMVTLTDQNFHPPVDGWKSDTIYYCIYRKVPVKRSNTENVETSAPKLSKHFSEFNGQMLNDIGVEELLFEKTIILAGELRDKLFNFLSKSSLFYQKSTNVIYFFLDGSNRVIKIIRYYQNRSTGDQAGDLSKQNSFVLITYDETSEESLESAKRVASEMSEFCRACVLGLKMDHDLFKSPVISLVFFHTMSEFVKLDVSNWNEIREAFKKIVNSSQHITLENWSSLKCFIETPRMFVPLRGKLRSYVQNLFVMATDPIKLIRRMHDDLNSFSQWHCLRLSSLPVVDILRCMLKSKHKSALGHEFIDVDVLEKSVIHEPLRDMPIRIPCFIIEFQSGENYQPIVFTTKVRYHGNEADFLYKIPVKNDKELGSELQSNDSDALDNYITERTLLYKLNALGYPWRSNDVKDPELLENDSSFQVPGNPENISKENEDLIHDSDNGNGRHNVNSGASSLISSDAVSNDHSHDSAVDQEISPNDNIVEDQSNEQALKPNESLPINQNLPPMEELGKGEPKNTSSRSGSRSGLTQKSKQSTKNSPLNRAANTSQYSNCGKKACQQAMVTTVKTEHGVNFVSGDKLVVDVIIYCSDIAMCRYLCAVFNLVHLDEILIHFENLKASTKQLSFKTEGIDGILRNQWGAILDCKDGCHRTIRMIQTRFSECTNSGRNNIAVTCCENILMNSYANIRAMIRFPEEKMRIHLYSIIVTLPDEANFIHVVAAFTKIIDLILRYAFSTIMPIYFDQKYYKVRISMIAMVPFYILRSYCEYLFKKESGDYLIERGKKLPPPKYEVV